MFSCATLEDSKVIIKWNIFAFMPPTMLFPVARSLLPLSRFSCVRPSATSLSFSCIGEGNGNPLQCDCLENPRDGGAWWPAICGVAQSQTQLKRPSSSSSSSSTWRANYLCASVGTHKSTLVDFECPLHVKWKFLPLRQLQFPTCVYAEGKQWKPPTPQNLFNRNFPE